MNLISKEIRRAEHEYEEIRRAEHEYMNIHPPPLWSRPNRKRRATGSHCNEIVVSARGHVVAFFQSCSCRGLKMHKY